MVVRTRGDIRLHLRQVLVHFRKTLLAGEDVFHQVLVKTHVGCKDGLKLLIRFTDFRLVLFQLNIDLVDFLAHGVILGQNLVELFLHPSEKLCEHAFFFVGGNLLNIEFIHDFAKRREQRS